MSISVGAGQIQPGPGSQDDSVRPGPWHMSSGRLVHLAVLTAGSIGCTLCPWPQLAGEVVTAGIGAVLWARAQRGWASEQAGLGLPPIPPRA